MSKPFPKRLEVDCFEVVEIDLGLFKQLLTKLHELFLGSQVRKRNGVETMGRILRCFVAFWSVRNRYVVALGSTLLLIIITKILKTTFLHERFVNNLRVVDQFGRCYKFALLLRHEKIGILARLQRLRPPTNIMSTLIIVGNKGCLWSLACLYDFILLVSAALFNSLNDFFLHSLILSQGRINEAQVRQILEHHWHYFLWYFPLRSFIWICLSQRVINLLRKFPVAIQIKYLKH